LQHLTKKRSFQDTIHCLQKKLVRRGIHYSLDRLSSALDCLHNPHLNLPPTIHIAGTNGKGSVAHALTHTLLKHKKSVLTYTSPHIQCYTERFQVNGNAITRNKFCNLFSSVSHCDTDDVLSEYEILTLMAFVLAKECNPDVLILETGLGGRLDATNVIPTSMAIITDIGQDHMPILGYCISDIAKEKAGIIKPNALVVTHIDHPSDVLEPIKHAAKTQSATLHWAPSKTWFPHRNHALVSTALETFFNISAPKTFAIPFGRFSPSSYRGTPCIMDVGHNTHAAMAILKHSTAISEWIIGMRFDKDLASVIALLIQHHQKVRICNYHPSISHDHVPIEFQSQVPVWTLGDAIHENTLFFGSFTFIDAILQSAQH
jgi:folylpolyglutamate synthase/dihydropteroate synthase